MRLYVEARLTSIEAELRYSRWRGGGDDTIRLNFLVNCFHGPGSA